jgi:hypothetical protein
VDSIAIKISLETSEAISDRIAAVARLDIHDLDVAAPRLVLRPPATGYVMHLVSGMMAIGQLGPVDHVGCHDFELQGDTVDWFISSGGLRKRLLTIAALADVLNILHSRGLVYADLNGGNVLVSVRPDRYRTILIDLDNLRHASETPATVWRPEFAPPEFQQSHATQAGDRFALCVMAWSLLTTKNPFYGTKLDGMPEHELAVGGPWARLAPIVGSPGSENSPMGLDPQRVIPRSLFDECVQTLEIDDPKERSPGARIAAAARAGAVEIVECECGWQNLGEVGYCYRCDLPLGITSVTIRDGLGALHFPAPVLRFGDHSVMLDRASIGLGGVSHEPAITVHHGAPPKGLEIVRHTDDVQIELLESGAIIYRRDRSPLEFKVQ